jgi:hypothetical protein
MGAALESQFFQQVPGRLGSGTHGWVRIQLMSARTPVQISTATEYDERVPGERSPEKAGVGGSIPSLATIF